MTKSLGYEKGGKAACEAVIQGYVESGKNRELKLMVIGEAGQGKSALINALVGKEVAEEGDTLNAGTLEVQKHKFEQNGVVVSIWDTPGFGMGKPEEDERILYQLKEKGCDNVDLALFCVRMDITRFPTRLQVTAIQKLNQTFGITFWKHCLFILTFANNLELLCPEDESMDHFFSQRCLKLEYQIKAALQEHTQSLDRDVLDTVHAVPVGSHRKGLYSDNQWALPDREDWFTTFWLECTDHIDQSALSALLMTNYHRLEDDEFVILSQSVHQGLDLAEHDGHNRPMKATPNQVAETLSQMEAEGLLRNTPSSPPASPKPDYKLKSHERKVPLRNILLENLKKISSGFFEFIKKLGIKIEDMIEYLKEDEATVNKEKN